MSYVPFYFNKKYIIKYFIPCKSWAARFFNSPAKEELAAGPSNNFAKSRRVTAAIELAAIYI